MTTPDNQDALRSLALSHLANAHDGDHGEFVPSDPKAEAKLRRMRSFHAHVAGKSATNNEKQMQAEAQAEQELEQLTPLQIAARQVGLEEDREATPDSARIREQRMQKTEVLRSTIMGHIGGATDTDNPTQAVQRNIQPLRNAQREKAERAGSDTPDIAASKPVKVDLNKMRNYHQAALAEATVSTPFHDPNATPPPVVKGGVLFGKSSFIPTPSPVSRDTPMSRVTQSPERGTSSDKERLESGGSWGTGRPESSEMGGSDDGTGISFYDDGVEIGELKRRRSSLIMPVHAQSTHEPLQTIDEDTEIESPPKTAMGQMEVAASSMDVDGDGSISHEEWIGRYGEDEGFQEYDEHQVEMDRAASEMEHLLDEQEETLVVNEEPERSKPQDVGELEDTTRGKTAEQLRAEDKEKRKAALQARARQKEETRRAAAAAEEEAKAKAEAEAASKAAAEEAEEAAQRKAEVDAVMRAEQAAKVKAEQERLTALAEANAAKARADEEAAAAKAAEEAARIQAEEEAAAAAAEAARLEAEREAEEAARAEAERLAKLKAEEEAKAAAAAEEAARAEAEEDAAAAAVAEAAAEAAKREAVAAAAAKEEARIAAEEAAAEEAAKVAAEEAAAAEAAQEEIARMEEQLARAEAEAAEAERAAAIAAAAALAQGIQRSELLCAHWFRIFDKRRHASRERVWSDLMDELEELNLLTQAESGLDWQDVSPEGRRRALQSLREQRDDWTRNDAVAQVVEVPKELDPPSSPSTFLNQAILEPKMLPNSTKDPELQELASECEGLAVAMLLLWRKIDVQQSVCYDQELEEAVVVDKELEELKQVAEDDSAALSKLQEEVIKLDEGFSAEGHEARVKLLFELAEAAAMNAESPAQLLQATLGVPLELGPRYEKFVLEFLQAGRMHLFEGRGLSQDQAGLGWAVEQVASLLAKPTHSIQALDALMDTEVPPEFTNGHKIQLQQYVAEMCCTDVPDPAYASEYGSTDHLYRADDARFDSNPQLPISIPAGQGSEQRRVPLRQLAKGYGASSRTGLATPIIFSDGQAFHPGTAGASSVHTGFGATQNLPGSLGSTQNLSPLGSPLCMSGNIRTAATPFAPTSPANLQPPSSPFGVAKPASQLGPRSPPPSPPRSPLRTAGGAEYQELPQLQTAQQWPLKHDKVWSQELFDEYVHKTPGAVPGIKKASPLMHSKLPPRSPGPPSLAATQELSPSKSPVKPSLDYDANVQRSLVIAESLQAKQQKQLEAVERRLQHDEKKLRTRIDKRLQEVEMKLHEALAEDRQQWQRRAKENTVREQQAMKKRGKRQ